MSTICDTIGLADVCQEEVDKSDVREAVFWRHYRVIKQEAQEASKAGDLRGPKEATRVFGNLDQFRMAMGLGTGLLDIFGDMPGRYQAILLGRGSFITNFKAPSYTR